MDTVQNWKKSHKVKKKKKKERKLFGCTPPTNPMFEAYQNIFIYIFKILNQQTAKLILKRQKMLEKVVNTDTDIGRPAIKLLHVQRRVSTC